MEYVLLKLTLLATFFTVIMPMFVVYIQAKAKMREKKKVNKETPESFAQLKAIRDIYLAERKLYADEARAIFNSLCKQGRMRHEDVVLLRKLLEESMGSYAGQYKGYKFENEYNRIYVYLKNWHIDVPQWKCVIDYLNDIYEQGRVLKLIK